jgi:clan AA aspartic protease (TIGR02281 family)
MKLTSLSMIISTACLRVMLLLTCAILPLHGEDPQSLSPALAGALRKSGLPPAAESVTIPLESTFWGFMVEVHIDGKPLRLLLDTGAACTVLSPDTARKLGLESQEGKGVVRSATGGQVKYRRALTKRISFGDAWTENEPVFVSEMIPGIDGLLGMSTLVDWDVRIDPSTKKLILFPASKAPPLEGETVMPLTCKLINPEASTTNQQGFRGMNLTVPVRVGNHELPATPDTGSGGILQIPNSLMEKFAPEALKNSQPGLVTSITLSGKGVSQTVKLPEFSFGPDILRGLTTEIIDAPPDSILDREGLIGLNLLRHYIMTFRFAAGELRIKPLGTVQEITRTSTAGINMGPEFKILSVVPDGPADQAGLRAGDELLEIEGHLLKTMKPEEFAAFKRMPPGSVVKVRYRRGEASPIEASLVLVQE